MKNIIISFLCLGSLYISAQTDFNTPVEGSYYQVQKGDNILEVAGKAYGVGPGGQRLKFAQAMNNHPLNLHLHIMPKDDYKKKHFLDGVITFSPKFNCDFAQTFASSGQKRCYARIYIPLLTEMPEFGGSINPSFHSACNNGGAKISNIRVNPKINSPSEKKMRWVAKGKGTISTAQTFALIDWFNQSTRKYDVDAHKLYMRLKEVPLRTDILLNNQLGTLSRADIRKWVRNYIKRQSNAMEGTPQLVWFAYPAEFRTMFEQEATLNFCLKNLYNKAKLPALNKFKKGEYWLLTYIAIPQNVWAKITKENTSNEIDQSDPSYQLVKKMVMPNWIPEEAQEWSAIYSDEVQVKRFPTYDKWDRDVIVWKRKGRVEAYREFINDRSYYLKVVQANNLFGWTSDEDVAKIVHDTYLMWNGDLSNYVEIHKISPSLAYQKTLHNSYEYLHNVAHFYTLILGGVANSRPQKVPLIQDERYQKVAVNSIKLGKWMKKNHERLGF